MRCEGRLKAKIIRIADSIVFIQKGVSMNNRLADLKKAIRAFFPNYTTERLAGYLAHAQDGKLFYTSCCCFIGGATAGHALRGRCGTKRLQPLPSGGKTALCGRSGNSGLLPLEGPLQRTRPALRPGGLQ